MEVLGRAGMSNGFVLFTIATKWNGGDACGNVGVI
jgi:hypothetical protein